MRLTLNRNPTKLWLPVSHVAWQSSVKEFSEMFRSFASGRLFSDLLSEVEDDASDGRKRGRVNRSKETRSDKIRKIQNIVHALEQNYNEILTFEFFNFNGSEAAEVDAKVRIVMFKGGVVHEVRLSSQLTNSLI